MRKSQRPAILLLLVSILLSTGLLSQSKMANAADDEVKVAIKESWFAYPSFLGIRTPTVEEPLQGNSYNCPNWGVDTCTAVTVATTSVLGSAVLPPCTEPKASYCVEWLELRNPGGEWERAEFVRSINAPTHEAVPEIGYPYGGTISLWQSPSVKHQGGTNTFAVQAVLDINEAPANKGIIEFRSLDMRVEPYTLEEGVFPEQVVNDTYRVNPTTGFGRYSLAISGFDLWQDRFGKGNRAQWVPGSGARVAVRIPEALSGWLGGRLSEVDFGISKLGNGINRLVVGGNAVVVQSVEANMPKSVAMAAEIISSLSTPATSVRGSDGFLSFKWLEALRPYAKDQSVGQSSYWVVQTFGPDGQKCLADTNRIVGVVTTSAVAYERYAPKFVDGKLRYRVGGVHLDKNGELVKGNYDLVLRSDAARCLYGFTDAPIDAVVSVTYGDKEQNVSTSVVGERDGWLFISAKNFTFSNPTIEVAISQPKPIPSPVATTTPTPSPVTTNKAIASKEKVTITCVKGKIIKKVVGATPKCPTGFKKRV